MGLQKAAEAVREAREAEGQELTLQQEKAQYRWEVRLEKREDRASRELNEQGHLIATIEGIDLGLLRSWLEEVSHVGRTAQASGATICGVICITRSIPHMSVIQAVPGRKSGHTWWDCS